MAKVKKSQTKLTTRLIEHEYFVEDRLGIYHCENCGISVVTHFPKDVQYCRFCGARVLEVVTDGA